MRPLIEVLEDERNLTHKLDSIYRYMLKCDDLDILELMNAKRLKIERSLNEVRNEIKEYIARLSQ